MPFREHAPNGSPCWADLWTSDVDGSRRFYAELFGWEAQEPSPEFGGYFLFTRDGVPVAGAMGDMGEMRADNSWNIYLSTDDVTKTLAVSEREGGQVLSEAMAVADLGVQARLVDPTGAGLGVWQPGTFPGFTVLNEHGAPSWFELLTRDYGRAMAFYRTVFGWETETVGDSDEFRYATMRDPSGPGPSGTGQLAGIMDASAFLAASASSKWSVYWEVDDAEAAVSRVKALGGSVTAGVDATPYGRLATVNDRAGAEFKLRSVNR
jgi:predicted enzyme related to lactoylglutathione lyase